MNRDSIFISHATPQDNEFSIWLTSRLEMLGYKVWIDKEGLLGGERFWVTIQQAIQSSAKVLFVYSKNIVTNEGILKQGIENEIEYAKSIALQFHIQDYIIPLHIDDSPYNLAIGLPNINHIPFNNNWAEGLKILKKKLEKDSIPQIFDTSKSVMAEWYENEYISNCSIIPKTELFYTSWWSVSDLPKEFYMYQFSNEVQAKAIRNSNQTIPVSLMSNVLSTFDAKLSFVVNRDDENIELKPVHTYIYSLNDILYGFESDKFPQHRDVENHFKRLLYRVVSNFLIYKGLWRNEMSNKRLAYFLPKYEKIKKIDFTYPYSNRKKSKSILGKFESIGMWHYAVSIQPMLFPFVGFSLKSHILFTSDGFKIIDDDKKQHSYRRKKGKRFFNEEWRDLLLAFLQRLKDDNEEIKIKVSQEGLVMKMKEWPEMFWSEVGYNDPNSKMDLDKIEDYYEEITEESND
ncbi:toll/interleukin-1 receptor domain-containing protein [Pseudopedobacter beijingensis]|uniref:Toll/interleukin-1 receptor domain-containing protein n=1 Tax=Pseudopedobacter beijingensis TaxID=1207056 RepID=A0ABW4ICV8_9SPHI